MKSGRSEEGAGVDAVVEEHEKGGPPVVSDRQRLPPSPWPLEFVRSEVECVQVGLRQIVAPCDIPLRLRFGEAREILQVILLPGRSYRLRGRAADTKGKSVDSNPAAPANGRSKTGQTRKPGRAAKGTENQQQMTTHLNHTGRFQPAKKWPDLTREMTARRTC